MTERASRRGPVGIAHQFAALILLLGLGVFGVAFIAAATFENAEAQGTSAGESDQSSALSRDEWLNKNVNAFADRLYQNGGTLDEWMKLVQYYGVLGKNEKALQALAHAKEDLKDDRQAVRRLNRFARMVGLKPRE